MFQQYLYAQPEKDHSLLMTVEYNAEGCSGTQFVELSCGDCGEYPNEGLYQKCVAQASKAAQQQGLLDNKERAGMVRAAAKASCE